MNIIVLIPLVQGRFLFTPVVPSSLVSNSLNPFGSGTFFILLAYLRHRKYLMS